MRLFTIGHSTRSLAELTSALQAHGIEVLVDVRSFPTSARYPHFNRACLEVELPRAGIDYRWLGPALGGYRHKTRPQSPHIALRSDGFRNYADHMETEAFARGIEELLKLAEVRRVAYLCAERLWWRCHRSLISDYLAGLRGVEIVHILDEKKAETHRLHRTARVLGDRVLYDVGESKPLLPIN